MTPETFEGVRLIPFEEDAGSGFRCYLEHEDRGRIGIIEVYLERGWGYIDSDTLDFTTARTEGKAWVLHQSLELAIRSLMQT